MATMSLISLPTEILKQIFSTFCLHCRAEQHITAPKTFFHSTPFLSYLYCRPEEGFAAEHESFLSTHFRQPKDQQPWYSSDYQVLYSLCLVSHRFCQIAQPMLYHEFMPEYANSWHSTIYTWNDRLTSFMRTMIDRRDLALLLRRLYIHPVLLYSITPDETQDELQEVANVFGIQSCQQLSARSLVGILAKELRNLEYLRLRNHNPYDTVFLPKIELCLGWQVGGLLELAGCLETLDIHMYDQLWALAPIPQLPHLRTLRITYSRLHKEDIRGLLSSCKLLETFIYEAASPNRETISNSSMYFKFSNVVQYLHPHKQTLRNLHMDLRYLGSDRTTSPESSLPTNLKAFAKLNHLLLNYDEIYRHHLSQLDEQLLVEFLPASIVSLHFTHVGMATQGSGQTETNRIFDLFARGLLVLAKEIESGGFPLLKQVLCDKRDRFPLEEYGVRDAFACKNIDFRYSCWKQSKYTFWPRSKVTLVENDSSPPGSPASMPLPEGDDPDL